MAWLEKNDEIDFTLPKPTRDPRCLQSLKVVVPEVVDTAAEIGTVVEEEERTEAEHIEAAVALGHMDCLRTE